MVCEEISQEKSETTLLVWLKMKIFSFYFNCVQTVNDNPSPTLFSLIIGICSARVISVNKSAWNIYKGVGMQGGRGGTEREGSAGALIEILCLYFEK